MENKLILSKRLTAAAALMGNCTFAADVGTDHAYLPIHLCLEGKAGGAIASDINKGPVERAIENIKKYGLEDKITVLLSDGLRAAEKYSPDCIAILGMGGELIAKIISEASWVKNGNIRLCLQPMTHPELLRKYLSENGFLITDEDIVEEDGKLYQLMLASYCGENETYTEAELLLGKKNIAKSTELLRKLGEHHIFVISRRIEGKKLSGADVSNEIKLTESIKAVIY